MITFDLSIFAFAANCLIGLAFFLTWLSTKRSQAAALYWAISHTALGGAAFLSFNVSSPAVTAATLGASALLGVSLATLAGGAIMMTTSRFRVGWVVAGALGFVGLIIGAATLFHPIAGRGLALSLLIAGNLGIGTFFWRRRIDLLVAGLFFVKAALQTFDFGRIVHYTAGASYSSAGLWLTIVGVFIALALIRLLAVSSQRRFERVLGFVTNGVYARTEDGTIAFSNRAFARMLGYPDAIDIEGRNISHLIPDTDENNRLIYKLNDALRSRAGEPVVTERPFKTRTGSVFDAEVTFQSFFESGQHLVLAQVRDISEQRSVERQLRAQATIDEVTGLPNRRLLIDRIEHAIAECRRRGSGLAVLFLDLDHFKRINDSFGHRIGDQWLAEAGRRLQATLRDSDTVGRFGGDEFLVVLHDIDRERGLFYVERVAQRLLECLQQPYTLGEFTTAINASIGIALYPQEGDDADLLIRRADTAMYEAKSGGRGRFSFFSDGMNERILDMLQLDSLLRQALEKDELFLQYQPIVAAHTHVVRKVEALVRWKSEQLGMVSPARFIPVAEESALILDLGTWVLRRAVEDWARWRHETGETPVLSVNVSARQFADSRFLKTVQELIAQHQIPPRCLELEMTERVLIDDDPKVNDTLHALAELGVSLSLDDFGTGYSSLSYLARFRLHTLKIDRSFIAEVDRLEHRKKLVQAIVSMGHSLGLSVVAEGVEDHEQRLFLEDSQCDLMQGYLFGRPMGADYLARLLSTVHAEAARAPVVPIASAGA